MSGNEPPAFQNYAGFYASPLVDTTFDNYRPILDAFDVNSRTPANIILNQVLASTRVPQVFATVILQPNNSFRIFVIHRPAKVVAQLGSTSAWDGQIFCTVGEVTGTHAVTVKFPEDPFDRTPEVPVASVDFISEFFDENPEDSMMPALEDNTAVADRIRTRHVMYLPCFLAPSLLRTTGYTPREFWRIAIPLLQDADKMDECRIFVDWLRIACSRTILRRNNNQSYTTIASARPSFDVPMMDIELNRERDLIINADLGGRMSQGCTTSQAIIRLVEAVTNQKPPVVMVDSTKDDSDKTVGKRWPQTVALLLRFTQSLQEEEVPEIYLKIAKANKAEVRKLIQSIMIERSTAPTAYCNVPLIVTPSIASMITDFDFVAADPDQLSLGLQPFIINNGTAEHRSASLITARQFDLLEDSRTGVALQDLEALLAKETKHVPLTFMETETTLALFGDLMVVLLGAPHVLCRAFQSFWAEWQRSRLRISAMIDHSRSLSPAHIYVACSCCCFSGLIPLAVPERLVPSILFRFYWIFLLAPSFRLKCPRPSSPCIL
jgi:hypothetical protein